MQVVAHDTVPRAVERLLPRASDWEVPGAMACLGRSEECGRGIPQTHTKHTRPPPAPSASLLPVMLNNQSNPRDHNMESGSARQHRGLTVGSGRGRVMADRLLSRTLRKEWETHRECGPSDRKPECRVGGQPRCCVRWCSPGHRGECPLW